MTARLKSLRKDLTHTEIPRGDERVKTGPY